jgi:hypothetical protein
MSLIIEWTIHTAGQKSKDIGPNTDEFVVFAIFDVKKLRQSSDVNIFRITDILHFLEGRGQGDLIVEDLMKWARNCDEYMSMGGRLGDGLVGWVRWEELSSPPPALFFSLLVTACFVIACTLAVL